MKSYLLVWMQWPGIGMVGEGCEVGITAGTKSVTQDTVSLFLNGVYFYLRTKLA